MSSLIATATDSVTDLFGTLSAQFTVNPPPPTSPFSKFAGASSTGATSYSVPVTVATKTGDTLTVAVSVGSGTVTSVSDSEGNVYASVESETSELSTYAFVSEGVNGGPSGAATVALPTTAHLTVVVTSSSTTTNVTGIDVAGGLQVDATAMVAATSGSGQPSVTTGALAASEEWVLLVESNSESGGLATLPSGTTALNDEQSGNSHYQMVAELQAPSSAAVTASMTIVSGAKWAFIALPFSVPSPAQLPHMLVHAAVLAMICLTSRAPTRTIGPLECTKLFYSGALPTTFVGQTEQQLPAGVLPVVCYKTQDASATASYVQSVTRPLWLIYYQEPEGNLSASDFLSQFATESALIRAQNNSNVKVVMCGGGYQYRTGGNAAAGQYLPPTSQVDGYTVDLYQQQEGDAEQWPTKGLENFDRWVNWYGLVSGTGKMLGITEYGVDAPTSGDVSVRNARIQQDCAFLRTIPTPLTLWSYWWVGEWQFTDAATEQTWQEICTGEL